MALSYQFQDPIFLSHYPTSLQNRGTATLHQYVWTLWGQIGARHWEGGEKGQKEGRFVTEHCLRLVHFVLEKVRELSEKPYQCLKVTDVSWTKICWIETHFPKENFDREGTSIKIQY